MFGPRLSSLFKSRWMALLWALGIIWTAISFVGFAPSSAPDNAANASLGTDVTGQPISSDDVATLKQVIEGK